MLESLLSCECYSRARRRAVHCGPSSVFLRKSEPSGPRDDCRTGAVGQSSVTGGRAHGTARLTLLGAACPWTHEAVRKTSLPYKVCETIFFDVQHGDTPQRQLLMPPAGRQSGLGRLRSRGRETENMQS